MPHPVVAVNHSPSKGAVPVAIIRIFFDNNLGWRFVLYYVGFRGRSWSGIYGHFNGIRYIAFLHLNCLAIGGLSITKSHVTFGIGAFINLRDCSTAQA